MSNPKVLELAKAFLPKIREMIDAEMAKLGAPAELGEKLKGGTPQEGSIAATYYETSNIVLKAVVAAAMQRAMDDGANRGNVSRRLGVQDGWVLFLERHPEVGEKMKAEQAAKEAKYAAYLAANPHDEDSDGGEDDLDDNEIDSNDDE
jgi:hypothetical protein